MTISQFFVYKPGGVVVARRHCPVGVVTRTAGCPNARTRRSRSVVGSSSPCTPERTRPTSSEQGNSQDREEDDRESGRRAGQLD